MRAGEVCAGYGGLMMAIEQVFNASPAWVSEFDEAPSKILAYRYPEVPNYGDMTKIDWSAIVAADIIGGGTPCQDLSHAGKRKGMTEGTRSNLWVHMREAIAIQRPQWVVWENVRGAYSAEAASDLEHCQGCMGDAADRGTVLRALGRVLGDLSDLGYDCQWRGLRAGAETNEGYGSAHVGSCHARFRVFVLAADRNNPGRSQHRGSIAVRAEHASTQHPRADAAYTESLGRGEGWAEPEGVLRGLYAPIGGNPSAADAGGDGRLRGSNNEGEGWAAGVGREAVSDARNGNSPRREAVADTDRGDDDGWLAGPEWESIKRIASAWRSETNWGEYEPAIRRWEFILGRSAPRPTERTGRNGSERLSPRFTEWMMGLPDGWVTDPAIGISRNEQLKACGNGVVPQQAMAALRDMLAAFENERIAA